MEAKAVLEIISGVLRYGPQFIYMIAGAMTVDEITPEKIKSLHITKDPEEYFILEGDKDNET
jgi:hypothetical protein